MTEVIVLHSSPVLRQELSAAIDRCDGLSVVFQAEASAANLETAHDMKPDVILLDVDQVLDNRRDFFRLMSQCGGVPTVAFTSRAEGSTTKVMQDIRAAASAIVHWSNRSGGIKSVIDETAAALRNCAAGSPQRRQVKQGTTARALSASSTGRNLLVIGASTGGTKAIEVVLSSFGEDMVPTLIVQHMPRGFTARFAARLDSVCSMEVREAHDGELLRSGLALVAPADHHLVIRKGGAGFKAHLNREPQVHHQRPSVDVCFHSVAQAAGAGAIGVLLTGMGSDGAEGLLAMRNAGALTIAQDKATSTVYGMPREAVKIGGAVRVAPLGNVAQIVTWSLSRQDGDPPSCPNVHRE